MSTATKLPRGVQLFKKRRAGLPARDLAAVPVGKSPWDVWPGDYFPEWRLRVRKEGLPAVVRSLGECSEREARERARSEFMLVERSVFDERARALVERERRCASLGEIFAAYRRMYVDGRTVAESESRRRVVSSARRFAAVALGWCPPVGETRIDDGDPLALKIEGLDSKDVFTFEMVEKYFSACQGGRFDHTRRERINLVFNQRLTSARQLFSARAAAFCYRGLELPDVARWKSFPLLPVTTMEKEEKLPSDAQMRALFAAADGLAGSADPLDRELALVNRCLSQLGLRTRELMAATGDWLLEDGGEWYLHVCDRADFKVKNATPGKLRLGRVEEADSLASVMVPRRERGHLVLPGGSPESRGKLVRIRHNKWLKSYIGEVHSRQGNHRLRLWVGTVLAEERGPAEAARYLRDTHAVAWEHYIAQRKEKLPEVTAAAVRRLVAV